MKTRGTKKTGAARKLANLPAASATDGLTDNALAITFPAPTANWGVVTHVAIEDQASNFLLYGALVQSKTVNDGDAAPNFPIGALEAGQIRVA